MKLAQPVLLLSVSLIATLCRAQAPAPAKALTCSVAPARNSPADKLYAAGDSAQSETAFTAQLASAPTATNYAGLVRAQLDQNKLPQALASARAAVAAMPAQAEAQDLLGDALSRAGQVPEAAEAYNKALALDRCSSAAHAGMSRLYDLTGRHLSAAREINFARKLAPADPAILAAYLQFVPSEQRAAPLKALLATHPSLPPAQVERLNDQLAVLTRNLNCTPTQPFNNARLDLQPIYQNGRYIRSWGLKTSMDEAPLPLFELDTTIDGIVLNTADAAKAHVNPLTAASSDQPYKAIAGTVQFGNLSFRDCLVTVVPDNRVDNRNSLVGANFFRDHVVHLDYVAKTLTLTPLPSPPSSAAGLNDQFVTPEEKDWSPVYVAGPAVLLPTLINKQGPYLFALDTGTGHSIFSPTVTKKVLDATVDTSLNLQGYSGAIIKVIPRDGGPAGGVNLTDVHGPEGQLLQITRPVKYPVLRFAASEIPDDSVAAFDITPYSHAAGIEVSALLGFHILSYYSLDINYRDALAHILFDPNRRYHVQQNDRDN